MVYVPFSTPDLYNWRFQNLSLSKKPQSLLEMLFIHTNQFGQMQKLLLTLFTEERERVRQKDQKLVLGEDGRPTVTLHWLRR